MDVRAAAALIDAAVPRAAQTWADLGAGTGTFTLALASLLGPGASVVAVDRDAEALEILRGEAERSALGDRIAVLPRDFRDELALPELDGVMLANALHFVPAREQPDFLARVIGRIRPAGRLLVVDYEGRGANPWVPYPVSPGRLGDMLRTLRLHPPTVVGTHPSAYGGSFYAAFTMIDAATRRGAISLPPPH